MFSTLIEVCSEAVRVQKTSNDRNQVRVDPDYERDPDEHEFHVMYLGYALAELLNLAVPIVHAVPRCPTLIP